MTRLRRRCASRLASCAIRSRGTSNARASVLGTITDVVPVIQSLARTMEKTHHDMNLAIELDLPPEARFRGERADLEEMIGNLMDNAYKWASARVSVEVG